MSLLEDLFLQDEAGEAQELERVLEGGGEEYDERAVSPTSDDNEERDDEAVEDKRIVDPNKAKEKRVIRNPRFVLNPARLTGPRGIQVIPDHFKDFKFKGKGHEKEDLDMVLKKLEHWAYRLYPKFEFHDCLKKIETLGKKKTVMVHLNKIRNDQYISEETVVQKDSSDDEAAPPEEDEFDKLLQQQIQLARSTPAPGSHRKPAFSTPAVDRSLIMPKATSSPSISDEQRERMLRNRRLAEERRLAKLKNDNPSVDLSSIPENTGTVAKKHNRSNVIDSSDDEDSPVLNESITIDVDVHNRIDNTDKDVIVTEMTKAKSAFDELIVATENRKDNNEIITIGNVIAESHLESGMTVDLTHIPENNTDRLVRKHNRTNVIDSSDDEDGLVINESATIDVDVHNRIENTEKDIIANSAFDDLIVATDTQKVNDEIIIIGDGVAKSHLESGITVDLTTIPENNIGRVTKKHNKTNVIDSSDDEDGLVINESVITHKSIESSAKSAKVDDQNTSEDMEVAADTVMTKNNSDFDINAVTDTRKDSHETSDHVIADRHLESESSDYEIKRDSNLSTKTTGDQGDEENINENAKSSTEDVSSLVDENNDTELVQTGNNLKDKEIFNSDKENVDSNIVDDVMDIDFNDDF